MKKTIFILVLFLAQSFSNAATLLVKEYGVNNTYSTIQAAINASVNNDTILVYDKPSGQLWVENITIDKDLWIANPIDTVRFKLQGNVTIVPKAGMQLFLVGYNLVGGGSINYTNTGATATANNRATILISDAIVTGGIDLQTDWLNVRLLYSTITGQLSFRHGIVAGNTLSSGIHVTQESAVGGGNDLDSLIIIGNKGTWCFISTRGGLLLTNNYFQADIASLNNSSPSGNVLNISNTSSSNNVKTVISNNSIINVGASTGNASAARIALFLKYFPNTSVVNNIISASGQCCNSNYGILDLGGSSGIPFISHNSINAGQPNNINLNNELNYINLGYGAIDAFGRASAGNTLCINKGIYLGQYYDIDLTRNDLGTYGGPFSIDNYITTSTSKGRVFWVDVPHQLSNINQLINISAGAATKF